MAVKLPVAAPAATVAETGTLRFALLLASDTDAPPLGAALVSVIAQLAAPGAFKVLGLQDKLLMLTETADVVVAEAAVEYALRLPA